MVSGVLVESGLLTRFASALFQSSGVPLDESDLVSSSLVGANLRGHDSHGVVRIPSYLPLLETGELVAGAELVIRSETPSMLCADAGFGFGMVQMTRLIERLVGGLSGGHCPPAPDGSPGTNNVLLVVWDPEMFAGTGHFLGEADRLIEFVRGVNRMPGVDSIRLSGDRSRRTMTERLSGGVPLDSGTWSSLCETASGLGIELPTTRSRA